MATLMQLSQYQRSPLAFINPCRRQPNPAQRGSGSMLLAGLSG
jgi:hypothetical protein